MLQAMDLLDPLHTWPGSGKRYRDTGVVNGRIHSLNATTFQVGCRDADEYSEIRWSTEKTAALG